MIFPTMSIVTPSFNQGRFIERTLQSVLDQEDVSFDYWVIDGGSSDETLAILEKYTRHLNWISESDRGQAHAVNKGIQRTQGEIIGWLNSDDIYYPGTLKVIAEVFTQHPEVDVVYGGAVHIDEGNKIIEPYYTEEWNFSRLKEVCFLCQPAVFFRRTVIKKFGGLNENLHYCMDYEYWLRLAQGGAHFFYCPIILAGSRLYQQNKTLGSRLAVHDEINRMLKKILDKVPHQWLSNYAHVFLEQKTSLKRGSRKFSLAVACLTVYFSFRWNYGVDKQLLSMVFKWIKK